MNRASIKLIKTTLCLSIFLILIQDSLSAQHSIAHQWNEVNLEAARRNGARPMVIARNLFHHSVVMYDAWAAYDEVAETYFLGNALGTYTCPFNGVPTPADIDAARHEAISYASYRLLYHRYNSPPGQPFNIAIIDQFMMDLGYDASITSTDYEDGTPAHLGNYIASELIGAGYADGSNEAQNYQNLYYDEVNTPLDMQQRGNPNIENMDRWQQLQMVAIWDASCGTTFSFPQRFLGPEWGNVEPFSLTDSLKTVYTDERGDWPVYLDPGAPATFNEVETNGDQYRWNHELVGVWSSHLDPADETDWDISPLSIGNVSQQDWPVTFEEYQAFYNLFDGGTASQGHELNPITELPYDPHPVRRGDYTRVVAEFWSDGPNSESPPGHWHIIYNEVTNHPDFTWQWAGVGEPLDPLQYDVMAFLTMGGAVHDAAVATWSVKGYYDYLRPVSALRGMADVYGQRTDSTLLDSYNPEGVDLIPGYIEVILDGDPLITDSTQYLLNEIKIKSWLEDGEPFPCSVTQDEGTPPQFPTEVAGVGWKPLKEWWPYQRQSSVSPPYAGYVSGHSAISRAGAEVLTSITGTNFFPGGLGVFECLVDSFLVFEDGPSETVELQWATYQDASDQCGLSRIWSGVQTPEGDIAGRQIGLEVGQLAFDHAQLFFDPIPPTVTSAFFSDDLITDSDDGNVSTYTVMYNEPMDVTRIPTVITDQAVSGLTQDSVYWTDEQTAVIYLTTLDADEHIGDLTLTVSDAADLAGNIQADTAQVFVYWDTENPMGALTDFQLVGTPIESYVFDYSFSETMDTMSVPALSTPVEDALTNSLSMTTSLWIDSVTYRLTFDLVDADEELDSIDIRLDMAADSVGNVMMVSDSVDVFSIDTRNPLVNLITANVYDIDNSDHGEGTFAIIIAFDEDMDQAVSPVIDFPVEDPLAISLSVNEGMSSWLSPQMYELRYDVMDVTEVLENIDVAGSLARDTVGNLQVEYSAPDFFNILLDSALNVADLGGLPISSIYPNPATVGKRLTIELSENAGNLDVSIFDLSGRRVQMESIANAGQRIDVQVDNLSEGMYLLLLENVSGRSLVKLQLQR